MGRWSKLQSAHTRALRDVLHAVTPVVLEHPRRWAEGNLSLSGSPLSAEQLSSITLDPHQVEPFECIFDDTTRSLAFCACQQLGKSLIWQAGLVTLLATEGVTAYIVYESDTKATKVNTDVLNPLMSSVPKLREYLKMPKTFTTSNIRFPRSVVSFHGSGREAASFSVRVVIASEVDRWDGTPERRRHVLNTLEHRNRRFEKLGTSKSIKESSPSTEDGIIWEEFTEGSQGYWHLGCLKCGTLMRSCDIHHLQWECDDGGVPIDGSCRLVCPQCNTEFKEDRLPALNANGRYVHRYPARVTHRSFQVGALAGFRSITWDSIARKQVKAGKDGGYMAQLDFDNSVRGLPYQQRRRNEERINVLKSHCAEPPKAEDVVLVFLCVDTQDDCWYYIIRALDKWRNSYLLGCGTCSTLDELDSVWNTDYMGAPPDVGMIDEGGHRKSEMLQWVADRPGMWFYKGNNSIGLPYKQSNDEENQPFLILARATHFKKELLYHVYSQKEREDHYWFLPPEDQLDADYLQQMQNVMPSKTKRNGHLHENWEAAPKQPDHFFDCEKQFFVAYHFTVDNDDPETWRTTLEV